MPIEVSSNATPTAMIPNPASLPVIFHPKITITIPRTLKIVIKIIRKDSLSLGKFCIESPYPFSPPTVIPLVRFF